MSQQNTGIVTVVKTCSCCGVPLRNDTYGMRCEDCFADSAANVPYHRRGQAAAKPLPPDPPKKTKKKLSLDDYNDE